MIYAILFFHYIADFCLQTEEQAKNKSSDWGALARHVGVYIMAMTIGIAAILMLQDKPNGLEMAFEYAAINGGIHFVTDAITSRISKHYYKTGNMPAFWRTIGADQLIHVWSLVLTLPLLGV